MPRFPENAIISLIGQHPHHYLGGSVGPAVSLAEFHLDDMPLSYASAAGDPRLRQIVADTHGVNADDVVITVGGVHALWLLAHILCDHGDEAVITSPVFPQSRTGLDMTGATVRTLSLSFDEGYQPDPAALRQLLSPRTKLVSLASPQNPSGVAIKPAVLHEIVATMQDVCPAAYLLLDETYREAAYGDHPIPASGVTLSPKVISVASLSKCHGAPGLRIGWAITRDADLVRQLVLGKFNTVISCSPVDEALALRLFAGRERIIADRRPYLAAGLARTARWVAENRQFVDWVRPDGGAVCCVRLKPGVFDDAAVGRFYARLEAESIGIGDGRWFGDEARVFRLGFGAITAPELDAGLAALSAALRQ